MVWLMEGERNEGQEIEPGEDEKLEEKRIRRFLGSIEGWIFRFRGLWGHCGSWEGFREFLMAVRSHGR